MAVGRASGRARSERAALAVMVVALLVVVVGPSASGPGAPLAPRSVSNPGPTILPASVRAAGAGSVVPVEGATVLATVDVGTLNFSGSQPSGMGYDSNDGDVYVADFGSNNVTIINDTTHSIVSSPPTGDDPIAVTYAPNTHDVYVMNFGITDDISAYRGTTYLGHVPVGPHPRSAVYDGANGYVYTVIYGGNNVSVVSGLTIVGSVNVGSMPQWDAYDPINHYVYVANTASNNVSVISGLGVVATISVGLLPTGVLYDPANHDVYVSDAGNDTVTVISGTSVVGTAITGDSPGFAAYDPITGGVYVPCEASDSLSIIQGTSTVANLSIGVGPRTATYANSTGQIYVTNQISSNVTVLNGSSIVASVGTGGTPYSGLYDAGTGQVYISDYAANNVTVIGRAPGNSYVTFNETGLAAGTNWSATLNTTTYPSNGTSVATYAANGTYPYAFPPVPGYISPAPGNVTVNGNDPVVTGHFVPAYPVDFNETGLPAGSTWGVTFSGTTQYLDNVSIGFTSAAGTYHYSIVPIPGYNTTWSGLVTVASPGVTVLVSLTLVTFIVTVSEIGLPAATPWTVTFNGSPYHSSAGTPIQIPEPNGSYLYSVVAIAGYDVAPRSGSITVSGGPTSLSLNFTAVEYPLVFEERGLPAGTNWSLVLAGVSYGVHGTSLTVSEPNGSYVYSAGTVAGYTGSGGGTAVVNGSGGTYVLTYTAIPPPPEYPITFTESGLPTGTNWSVALGRGPFYYSMTTTIVIDKANGSYSINANATGWIADSAASHVRVAGGPVNVSIEFSPAPPVAVEYSITFAETGLSAGSEWSITMSGTSASTSGTSITRMEPNGSYDYAVGGPSRYAIPAAGTVVVAGHNVSITLGFSASPSPTFLGLPATAGYLVVGLLVLLVLAAVVLLLRRRPPRGTGPGPAAAEGPAGEAPAPEIVDEPS